MNGRRLFELKSKKQRYEITSSLVVGSMYELKKNTLFHDPIHGWKMFDSDSVMMLLEYDFTFNFSETRQVVKMKFLNPEGTISTRTDFDENIYLYLQLKQ